MLRAPRRLDQGISGWARRNGSSSLRAASPMIVRFRHTASIIRGRAGQSAPPVPAYSGRGRPVRPPVRRVLGDAPATVPDVHHVDERVLGGHAHYRGTASASTLSRISWMNVSSFYEVHIDPQQIMETRE